MIITLIRHGLTEYNHTHRVQGFIDIPLNDIGIHQAEIARDHLKDDNFDVLYSSPLSRALRTGQIINEYHHLDIHTLDELKEQNFNEIEGMFISDVIEKYPDGNVPSVESFESLTERVKKALEYIYETEGQGTRVLLTAHSRTIKAILKLFDDSVDIKLTEISNCSISRIELDDNGGKVLEINTRTNQDISIH